MSLASWYGWDPEDEEELFRLTSPDTHPSEDDAQASEQEERQVSSGTYRESQDAFDECATAELTPLDVLTAWRTFNPDQRRALQQFIHDMLNLP